MEFIQNTVSDYTKDINLKSAFGAAVGLGAVLFAGPVGLAAAFVLGGAGLLLSKSKNDTVRSVGKGLAVGTMLGALGTGIALLLDNPAIDFVFSRAAETVHSIEGVTEIVNNLQGMLPK